MSLTLQMILDGIQIMNKINQKRRLNEQKFLNWEDLPDGGRKYWLEILGKHGYKARYVKVVDEKENTVKFWQERYMIARVILWKFMRNIHKTLDIRN